MKLKNVYEMMLQAEFKDNVRHERGLGFSALQSFGLTKDWSKVGLTTSWCKTIDILQRKTFEIMKKQLLDGQNVDQKDVDICKNILKQPSGRVMNANNCAAEFDKFLEQHKVQSKRMQ